MKKIWSLLILIILLIPFNVFALEGSIIVDCDKTTLALGGVASCAIKGVASNGEVSSLSAVITISDKDNLTIEDINVDSIWQGDGNGGSIDLYTDTNKGGTFNIATFTIKASSNNTSGSDVKVNVTGIKFYDGDYREVVITDVSKDIRIASTIDTLTSLELVEHDLSPVFEENTFNYTTTIDSNKVTINAIARDSKARISGDVGEVELNYGINNFAVNVTSEAGTVKTYSIIINRPDNRDTDNTLASLKINGNEIKLDKSKFEYSYEVDSNVTEASIVATLSSLKAVAIDAAGLDRKVKLVDGKNKVEIKVMAENEKVATYTITINKKAKAAVTNPKTGGSFIWVVLGVLVVSVVVGICSYEYYKKKVRKDKNEKK